MNTLVIVMIAAVCLLAGYTLYGRWLAEKWGIDPKAKTPACALEDGQGLCAAKTDGRYSPTSFHPLRGPAL